MIKSYTIDFFKQLAIISNELDNTLLLNKTIKDLNKTICRKELFYKKCDI